MFFKKPPNVWPTFEKIFATKTFQKSTSLVTLAVIIELGNPYSPRIPLHPVTL